MIDETQLLARRFRDHLKFHVERLMLRGAQYRLLVIAFIILLLALIGGGLVFATDPEIAMTDAVWWAFLRMTDPGYLGDDEGVLRRSVSTFLTICGYVLFMGALIAIMTQWLHDKMRHLEMGLTPITKKNHMIVLGWTNRTPDIVRDVMLSSERVKRFLARIGVSKLAIVILAEEVRSQLYVELHEQVGRLYKRRQIIMRSGTPLRLEHLNRVDFLNAAVIVLPADDYYHSGTVGADTRTIKTLLSISRHTRAFKDRQPPLLVAELFDPRKVKLAERAYAGPIEIVSGDAVICRLIAQSVRHRGVSFVLRELLTQGHGNEIYVRDMKNYKNIGHTFGEVSRAFERAIAVGIVRWENNDFRPVLCPPENFAIAEADKIVLVARTLEDCDHLLGNSAPAPNRAAGGVVENTGRRQRILVLGWSRRAVPLLQEFDSYKNDHFEIDVLSRITREERENDQRQQGYSFESIALTHYEADFTVPMELERLALEKYDNIIILANDRLESEEESDARTLSGYLLLTEILAAKNLKPAVLVELMDSQNAPLLAHFPHELLVSPEIVSHMLVQVALRRELNSVLEELFGSRGPEISFSSADHFGITGREMDFGEIQSFAHARGQIALGIRRFAEMNDLDGGTHLNPKRSRRWKLEANDDIIVLSGRE